MNINGLGNLYDRTYETYRIGKYAQSFSAFLDKINEDKNKVSDMPVKESTEEKSDDNDKKEMPEEPETRTEIVVNLAAQKF